ncbi:DUF2150 family protein [Archaeoglobus sp.]
MEFYTEERFRNWINKIAETEIDLEKSESLNVFDQVVEDFTVACLNIIRALKEREITKKQALQELDEMSNLILTSIDFGDEIKNELFEFIRESIKTVLYSTKLFIEGKSSKKSFEALLKEAVKKEQSGDFRGAFEAIARMGAKILKGEKLPENLEIPEDGFVINWLDGVEMIDMVVRLTEIDSSNETED